MAIGDAMKAGGAGRRLRAHLAQEARRLFPGLALALVVTLAAYGLRYLPGGAAFSPLVIAIVVGMVVKNLVGTPAAARPGMAFAIRRILRFAIVLLGLQLTLEQVAGVGAGGLLVIVLTLTGTFFFTRWAGRLLGVEARLAELIAAGTSICGASAVIATNTVTRGSDEDVAYAVACVTVFGSLSMVLLPVLMPFTGFDAQAYGLWAGASIHEVAQVVAAAFQGGQAAGEAGTIAKLSRVMLLAPMVLALGFVALRRSAHSGAAAKPPVPWFVFGFMAMIAVNSLHVVPADLKANVVAITTFLLAIALAAMGLETDVRKLKEKGLRPLALGATAWLFITAFSFILIVVLAPPAGW